MLFIGLLIVHVLTVILWFGGLAFVTIIIFPSLYKIEDIIQKSLSFQRVEHRFAKLARYYAATVGISGLAMAYMTGWHMILFTRQGLFLTIMFMIWVMWVVMLFGLEPFIIKKMLERMIKGEIPDVNLIFKRLNKMHWVLLSVSLIAAASGILFAHGYGAR
ncbi:MAG: hypothetical protein HZC10_03525 [Nitrospirae bacterium]|nr:hypothetical protein [Nitrospirota bacterium]